MQNTKLTFNDVHELIPGQSKVFSEAMGMVTYIGMSAEGDAVVQLGDNFTTLPEVTFNIMAFQTPFEPETHVKYAKEEDINRLHDEYGNILQINLNDSPNMIYEYEICMTIKKVYNQLGSDDE